VDATFKKRLCQAESEVVREFGELDPDLVHREFTRVVDDLLRNARVMDFVPVLAHRQARELLRNEVGATAVAPAAKPLSV
jgi:hypothetical protein